MTTDDAPSERERSSAPDARRSTGDHGDAAAFEGAVLGGVEGGEDLCKIRVRARARACETGSGRRIVRRGNAGADCVGLPLLRVDLRVGVHGSEWRNVTGAGHWWLRVRREDERCQDEKMETENGVKSVACVCLLT